MLIRHKHLLWASLFIAVPYFIYITWVFLYQKLICSSCFFLFEVQYGYYVISWLLSIITIFAGVQYYNDSNYLLALKVVYGGLMVEAIVNYFLYDGGASDFSICILLPIIMSLLGFSALFLISVLKRRFDKIGDFS